MVKQKFNFRKCVVISLFSQVIISAFFSRVMTMFKT